MRWTDTPLLPDLIFSYAILYIENVMYDTPFGESDHAMLKFDCVIFKDVKRAEVREYLKRTYNRENYESQQFLW